MDKNGKNAEELVEKLNKRTGHALNCETMDKIVKKAIGRVIIMCGFAGFCDISGRYTADRRKIVSQMTEKIRHRGPDSGGIYSDNFLTVGFCRLKIIDFKNGEQPMYSSDGRYILCFNGEIYNFRSLRSELEELHGKTFKTASDTEVLLTACIVFGDNVVSKIRGMYSFVLYDRRNKSLLCVRDPFGIKPLYYGVFDGCFIFASECKAFLSHPAFDKKFNTSLLPYYLQFQYIPSEETAFEGVYRVMPGHMLKTDGKNIEKIRYFYGATHKRRGWYEPFNYFSKNNRHSKLFSNKNEAADTVLQAISDSVNAHLVSDTSVAAFLSGGIDSGLIVALSKPENVYSIGFSGDNFDERSQAAETARHTESTLNTVNMTADDFFGCLPAVQYYSDEPHSNLSAVPLFMLARRASADVKVVLSGEGADEFFGGYEWYLDSEIGKLYRKMPKKLRAVTAKYTASHLDKGSRVRLFAERNVHQTEKTFIGQAKIMSEQTAFSLLSERYKTLKSPCRVTKQFYSENSGASELRQKMYLDQNLWLWGDILQKADKMTMANSLELRVPYIDLKVYNASSRLPDTMLINGNQTKVTLRQAARAFLPHSTVYRKKKGFPVPFREWIREDKYYNLIKEEFSREECAHFFEKDKILLLLEDHKNRKSNNARVIYTIYAFLVWYGQYFRETPPVSFVLDRKELKNEEVFANNIRL